MTIEECIVQCEFTYKTLNSGCVKCDKKAKDFYQSVITYLKKYKKITLENREYQNQKEYELKKKKADRLTPLGKTSLSVLNLSISSLNCLLGANITSVEELEKMSDRSLKVVKNLGKKSFTEITKKLADFHQNKEGK